MKCKKILQMLSFFVFLLCLHADGQTFRSVDLERLIQSHPMMKNFDQKTGRFKNTNTQVRPVEEIKKEISQLNSEINDLRISRQELLCKNLANTANPKDDQKTWETLNEMEKKSKSLKSTLESLEELLTYNGVPPLSRNLTIARKIISETKQSMKVGEDEIIINKLPRFFQDCPFFSENPLKKAFAKPGETYSLIEYMNRANTISLLFNEVAEPILFQEGVLIK